MLTFPATNAIRSAGPTASQRPDQRSEQYHRSERSTAPGVLEARSPAPVGLVVHLEFPQRALTGSGPDSGLIGQPDLHQLARAVEDLIRVAVPTVITKVTVESTPPNGLPMSTEAAPSPRLRTVPPPPSADVTGPQTDPAPAVPGEDGLDIDLVSRTIRADGVGVDLTRREFDLLAYLYRRRGVALSRRELMNAVWQTGYLPGDRTIDVHVRRVRAKLGQHADRLTTLRGFGYRFD